MVASRSHLHPNVKIGDDVIPLNRTPNILGVTWDPHLTFGPHVRDFNAKGASGFRILKALAGTNGDLTERHWFPRRKSSPGLY